MNYTKGEKEREIGETFINGNISVAKKATKSKARFIGVLQYLQEFYPQEVESFIRICGK